MSKSDDFLNDDDATAIDLSAVHSDDRLIEALRTDGYVTTQSDAEYELASLLAGWRIETAAAPIPAGPTLEEVEARIERASVRQLQNKRMRRLQIVSGAAAVVAIAIGGLTVAAHDASPGSALWGVKQVMFSQAAAETTNMVAAQDAASSATSAIDRGDRYLAQQYLSALQDKLSRIHDDGNRQQVESQIDSLRTQLGPTGPLSTVPMPSLPSTLPWTMLQRTPTRTVPTLPDAESPTKVPTIPPSVTLPVLPLPTVTMPSPTIPTVPTIPSTVTVPTIQPGSGTLVPTVPTFGGGVATADVPKL